MSNSDGVIRSLGRLLPTPVRSRIKRLAKRPNYVKLQHRPTFNSDGLVTVHNCDFVADPKFKAAYEAGERTGSWKGANIAWRAHVACWAARQAMNLDGDFVECGVNRGGLSRAVCEYVDFETSGRTFYLLDTFQGLVAEQVTAEERALGISASLGGYYEECYSDVVATFNKYPNVKIVRGPVPDTLPQVATERVAYLSIDMNCVAPEIAAAEYFWDRLVPGAVVVLDDYGWSNHILQKRAFDEFARACGIEVLSMPTGQGLMIKP